MRHQQLNYKFSSLLEAQAMYHKSVDRLEEWVSKYPNYDFDVKLLTTGHREPTVQITINKNAPTYKSEKAKGNCP
jgi:hypothetical protein